MFLETLQTYGSGLDELCKFPTQASKCHLGGRQELGYLLGSEYDTFPERARERERDVYTYIGYPKMTVTSKTTYHVIPYVLVYPEVLHAL